MLITSNPVIDVASDQQPSIYYLDDGTAIFKVVSDPNGSVIANAGSLALRDNGAVYAKASNNDALNWNLVGGGSPGLPLNSVQFNDAGSFGGNDGFIYVPGTSPNVTIIPDTGTGVLIKGSGTTPPPTLLGAPSLLHLHSINSATASIGFSSDDTTMGYILYSASTGELTFYGAGTGFSNFFFTMVPNATQAANWQIFPAGMQFYVSSATYYGGFAEISSDKFGLMLTTFSPTSGAIFPLTWTKDAVGIFATTPLATLHVKAPAGTSVAGLFITNAGSVDNFQISVNNGVSSAVRVNSAGRMILSPSTTTFTALTSGTYDFRNQILSDAGLVGSLNGVYSATQNDSGVIGLFRSRGTQAAPSAVLASDSLGRLDWFAQYAGLPLTQWRNVASISAIAAENHSGTVGGTRLIFSTVANGGAAISEKMRLTDAGMLQIGNTATYTAGVNLFSVGNITNNSSNVASIAARNTAHIALDVYAELNSTVEAQRWFQTFVGTKIASVMSNGKFETRAGQNGTAIASDFISLDGTYDVFTTDANNGTTVETDLHSKTVSANVLATDGDILYCVSTITTANNANNKTIKAYWNGVVVLDTGAFPFINDVLTLEVWITRTGGTTQKINARLTNKDATYQISTYNTGAATLSSSVIYKITGQSDTASNDVTARTTFIRKGNNQ